MTDIALGEGTTIRLDPISLILRSSGPVFVVVWVLIAAAALVWVIALLKLLQLGRLGRAERRFQHEAQQALDAEALFAAASRFSDAPGAYVVLELGKRAGSPKLLESVAKRALIDQEERVESLMNSLSTIASAAPFVGLFGTVYGIMDAFLRIGQAKSASLPVVAPAIGEALIATAIGLAAAIPAVVAYNSLNKRIDGLMSTIEAASNGWVALVAEVPATVPRQSAG
jgi:biopolymer transport protein TolQ